MCPDSEVDDDNNYGEKWTSMPGNVSAQCIMSEKSLTNCIETDKKGMVKWCAG